MKNKQDILQQELDKVKVDKPSIIRGKKRKEYNETKKDLKSQLHEASKEKWQNILDQKFEESKDKPLDEVANEIGSDYIKREIKNNRYCTNLRYKNEDRLVRFIGEIADRISSSKDINYGDQDRYTDWRILFKIEMNKIKTLLENEDKTLTKEDKKALKEIRKDLQKDKKKRSIYSKWERN